MTLRLLAAKFNGAKSIKIYRDAEWQEFVVRFYQDGKELKDAEYRTDDKSDAEGTADHYLKGDSHAQK